MNNQLPFRPCPHGLDPFGCPACVDEMHDEHVAVMLAAQDVETVEQWRQDFEASVASTDYAGLAEAFACR